jgi:hypothetical protein
MVSLTELNLAIHKQHQIMCEDKAAVTFSLELNNVISRPCFRVTWIPSMEFQALAGTQSDFLGAVQR